MVVVVAILLVVLVGGTGTASAQGSDTPIAVPEPANSKDAAFFAAWEAEAMAYYSSLNITDLNIVLFADPDAVDVLGEPAADVLERSFGAVVAPRWDDVLAAAADAPIDVLIVHKSRFDQVDIEWTYEAYRAETTIVAFDLSFENLQTLTGDTCLKEPNRGLRGIFPNRFLYFNLAVRLDNPNYRESLIRTLIDECSDDWDIPGRVDVAYGTVDLYPTDAVWVRSLESMLLSDYGGRTFWHVYPEWYSNTREIPERLSRIEGD